MTNLKLPFQNNPNKSNTSIVYPNMSDAMNNILMATYSTIRQSNKQNGLLTISKLI